MVYDELYFGGDVVPAVVEKFPVIRKAQRKFTSYNIPGRNGDIIVQQDAYNNVILPYQIWCGEEGEVQTDWTDLAAVLYKDGYQKLSDIADPEHYRKAVFNGPIDAQYYWDQVGRTTLEFNCRPERYLVDGQTPISYAACVGDETWWASYKKSDLSAEVQLAFYGISDGPYIAIPVYADPAQSSIKLLNLPPSGFPQYAVKVIHGTEATSTTPATAVGIDWSEITKDAIYNYDYLFPSEYFDGIPMVSDNGIVLGATELQNNYMPSKPTLKMHRTAFHSTDVLAMHINGYGVYVRFDPSSGPYYYIDTQTMIATSSTTDTSVRYPARNVRIDPEIVLNNGVNYIYTSQYYEIELTPNWWEL